MEKKISSIVLIIIAIVLFNIGSMGITQGVMEDSASNTVISVLILVGGLVVLIIGFKSYFPRIKKKTSDEK